MKFLDIIANVDRAALGWFCFMLLCWAVYWIAETFFATLDLWRGLAQ